MRHLRGTPRSRNRKTHLLIYLTCKGCQKTIRRDCIDQELARKHSMNSECNCNCRFLDQCSWPMPSIYQHAEWRWTTLTLLAGFTLPRSEPREALVRSSSNIRQSGRAVQQSVAMLSDGWPYPTYQSLFSELFLAVSNSVLEMHAYRDERASKQLLRVWR